MKACGIVAEYNPFHNGHAYQIQEIRRELKPDVVIAVMSGNFLQRGEPAIVDKWTRTKMALAGGVDLVVELPVHFSTQAADFFARGAIQILSDLGIDWLSFGVEKGTSEDFLFGAQWLVENEARIDAEIKKTQVFDVPYAKQMEEVLLKLAPEFPLHLNSPNNQLGFAYAKEIVRHGLADELALFPITRKSAGYDDQELKSDSNIASATAIRLAKLQDKDVGPYIPSASNSYFAEASDRMVTWEDYFPYLKYQLTVQSAEELRAIYQMTEGLEYRLKEHILEANSFSDFMQRVKTKRYTQTRLQRLMTYVLLQWSDADVQKHLKRPQAIRILGFSPMGQKYLSKMKHQTQLPLITNVNQENAKDLRFDISAGEIYQLGKSRLISKQDFTEKPVKLIDRNLID